MKEDRKSEITQIYVRLNNKLFSSLLKFSLIFRKKLKQQFQNWNKK